LRIGGTLERNTMNAKLSKGRRSQPQNTCWKILLISVEQKERPRRWLAKQWALNSIQWENWKQSKAKQIIEEVEVTKARKKGAKWQKKTDKMADKNNNELSSCSRKMDAKREPGICHHWMMTTTTTTTTTLMITTMMIIVHVSHPLQCHCHFIFVVVFVVDWAQLVACAFGRYWLWFR